MAEQKGNLANTIRTIYFYFFSAFGLILLIVGIFQTSQWGAKKSLLPKYDLNYEETRCDYMPVKIEGETSTESASKEKENCKKNLEELRQTRQVTDLAQALTFIVIGGAVFTFHFRKTSLFHK